ncbi:uncharacterized protein LOC126159853 [Schistocerca cancellata]|uniref:uncharacterized protein LOC126159853 n=1 Tax=Schistocerca cancellata TaxID=274614 RepID=UPI002117F17F|nr:uncharacterized protein LOC126159853 [Schistocerca cancellata]
MEEKREWTKQDTENFIEAVESYPEIWDVHNRDFKDRMKKMCALNEISSIFDTSVKEVQRKWHNLKTQFSQEVRKLQKIKSGSPGIVSDSRWPYFSAMKFLESSVATTSNRISSLSTKEEEIVTGDDVPVANEGKKLKRKETKGSGNGLIEKAEKILGQEIDAFQTFGDYVASELRSLKNEKNVNKLKIMILKNIIEISEIDSAEIPSTPVSPVRDASAASQCILNVTDFINIE